MPLNIKIKRVAPLSVTLSYNGNPVVDTVIKGFRKDGILAIVELM